MPKRTCPNGHVVKDRKATHCPQCGEELAPLPPQKKWPIVVGVLGAILICGLIALSLGDDDEPVPSRVAEATVPPSAKKPTSTKAPTSTKTLILSPMPKPLKPTHTPTPERSYSTIVAKDESDLAMPGNKVQMMSIPKGWGDDRASDSRLVIYLQHGERVEILDRKGLDIHVKAHGKTGWVRGWFVETYRHECLRDYQ